MSQALASGFTDVRVLEQQEKDLGDLQRANERARRDLEYERIKRLNTLQVLSAFKSDTDPKEYAAKIDKDVEAFAESVSKLRAVRKETDKKLKDAKKAHEATKTTETAELLRSAEDTDQKAAANLVEPQERLTALKEAQERLKKDPDKLGELVAAMPNALAAEIEDLEKKIVAKRREAEELAGKLGPVEEQLGAYNSVLTIGGTEADIEKRRKLLEKKSSGAAARNIEKDLLEMQRMLKAFPDETVSPIAQCKKAAIKAIRAHVAEIELTLDHIAHRGKCDCDAEHGIERSAQAKDAVRNVVGRLERIAHAKPQDLTAEDQKDAPLAQALKAASEQRDEDGATAGKMIGVLICENPLTHENVTIQAFSGTVMSKTRMAYAELNPLLAKKDRHEKSFAIIARLENEDEAMVEEIRNANVEIEELERKRAERAKQEKPTETVQTPEPIEGTQQPQPSEKAKPQRTRGAQRQQLTGEELDAKALDKARRRAAGAEEARVKIASALQKQQSFQLQERDRSDLEKIIAFTRQKVANAEREDTAIDATTEEAWAKPIPMSGALKNRAGQEKSLVALNNNYAGTPHGVCAAPKMLQEAFRRGLKPLAMAEAWFGGGTNPHGELIASCETCVKNIGFQLHGND